MNSMKVTRLLTPILMLATANSLTAQDLSRRQEPKHHKYEFIDLGTFGGPDSAIPFIQHVLTKRGTVVGVAETDVPDPFAPNCVGFSPNCRIAKGFKWGNEEMIELGGLYEDGTTEAQAINNEGTVVGEARTGLIDPNSGLPQMKAVLWRHGKIADIGPLAGILARLSRSVMRGKSLVGRTPTSSTRMEALRDTLSCGRMVRCGISGRWGGL
jgi:hypothetical protein